MSEPKHHPAPWEYENVPNTRERTAYGVVKDANGKILFDTLNSDVAEIHTEPDGDGPGVTRWDESARKNLTIAAAAPELLAACKALPLDCAFEDAADFKDNAAKFLRAIELARRAVAKATGAQ